MRSIIITFFLASFATTAVYAATSGSINTGFYNKYTVAGGVCFSSSAAVITEVDSYSLGQCCPIISAGKTSYVVFSLRYDYGLLYEDTYSNNVCSGTPRVYSQALDSAKCTWSYTSTLPSDPAITNGNSMWVTNNYYTNPTFCTAHGMPLYALKTQVAAIGSTLHPTCVPDGTGKGFQMYYQTYVYPATAPTPMPTIAQPPTQAPTLSAKNMMIVYISLGVFVGLIVILVCACWYCQCCCFASADAMAAQAGYQPLNQQSFNQQPGYGNNPMNQQGFNQQPGFQPGYGNNPMNQQGFNQQPGFQPGYGNDQMNGSGPPPVMA